MRDRRSAIIVVLCLGLAPLAAFAQERGVFEWNGSFEVGFRAIDITGSEHKYNEDVNIHKGPRLFELDLNVTPGAGETSPFDILNVSASNLGGDPYESFGVTLKKFHKYNFRYQRTKSTYFYADTIVPPDMADAGASTGGDFHTSNFDRTFNTVNFDYKLIDRVKVFFNFDRQDRRGEKTTTLYIAKDEFELDAPVNDIKDDYTAGFEAWFNKFSLYFDETYRDYRNGRRLFLPGFSLGETTDDAGELLFFEQMTPFDFKMPQTTIKANIHPTPRVAINAGYIYANVDGDLGYAERALGTNYNGQPLDYAYSGSGELDRTIQLFDVDAALDITRKVAVVSGMAVKKLDQDGTVTAAGETGTVDGNINTRNLRIGARVTPSEKYTVTAGLHFENRELEFSYDTDDSPEAFTTKRTTWFFSGVARPSPKVNFFGEYEHGSYDNPYTLMSPSTLDRLKFRGRAKIVPDFTLMGTFLRRDVTNDLQIDDTMIIEGKESELTSTSFSARGSYKHNRIGAYAGYTWTAIDNAADHQVDYIDFSGNPGSFPWLSLYKASNNHFLGGVNVDAHKYLVLGFHTNIYKNEDSFELGMQEYQLYGQFKCQTGYRLRVAWDRVDYNEEGIDWDDYKADILTVGIGYEFGK